jgi:hypothetical protein
MVQQFSDLCMAPQFHRTRTMFQMLIIHACLLQHEHTHVPFVPFLAFTVLVCKGN